MLHVKLLRVFILLISAVLSFLLSIFFHETGHLVLGRIGGYQLKTMFVGPFVMTRQDKNFKIHFAAKTNPLRGGIDFYMKDMNLFSRKNNIMMLLGGPVASLFISVLALFCYRWTHDDISLLLAVCSFMIGIGTFIPLTKRSGLQYTDGKRVLELCRNSEHGKNELAFMFVYQCYIQETDMEYNTEINEALLYMTNHQLEFDMRYAIFAFTYILEKKLDILEQTDIMTRIHTLYNEASLKEKQWMQLMLTDVMPKGIILGNQ